MRDVSGGPVTPAGPRNGLGTAGLVLGAIAVIASPTLTFGVLLGVPAVVLGFLARQRVRRGEASNARSAWGAMALGAVALAVVTGLIVYGRVLLDSPAGARYQACVQAAGDDGSARQICDDRFEQER